MFLIATTMPRTHSLGARVPASTSAHLHVHHVLEDAPVVLYIRRAPVDDHSVHELLNKGIIRLRCTATCSQCRRQKATQQAPDGRVLDLV
jgi:hypothetical protein